MFKRFPSSVALLTLLPLVTGCVSQPAKETTGTSTAKAPVTTVEPSGVRKEKSLSRSAPGATSEPSPSTKSATLEKNSSSPSDHRAQAASTPQKIGAESIKAKADTPTLKQVAAKPQAKPRAAQTPVAADSVTGRPKQSEILTAAEPLIPHHEPEKDSATRPTTPALPTVAPGADSVVEADAPEQSLAEPVPAEEQETQLALIEKSALNTPPKTKPTELIYDEENLPITFPGGWILERDRDRRDGATRCLVFSPPVSMFDGYDRTEIKLQVTPEAVLVETQSNIDINSPAQGLSVDGTELVPFETELVSKQVIHTEQPVQTAMAGGERLTVALGFWPSWPVTKTQQVSLSLEGFEPAYAALQKCSSQ